MHLVRTEAIRPGMRLGKSITTFDNRVLLRAGTTLQQSYIQPLLAQGISVVYVETELADIEPTDVISREVRTSLETEMNDVLSQVADALQAGGGHRSGSYDLGINLGQVQEAAHCVADSIMLSPGVVFNLQDIRAADEYTLGHSVNVCILSTLLGAALGYSEQELRDLATGALLHDIGKVAIPQEVLNKPGRLTPEEFEIVKQHTTIGWMILSEQRNIRYTSSIIALQHHEQWSGGGYPRGISGAKIYKHSRVVAVADCFDALTADRVYKRGMAPDAALAIICKEMANHFQPGLPEQFARCIAPYPVGCTVEITGGGQAVVVANARDKTYRPRVRLVQDSAGRELAEQVEIDLSEHPDLAIVRVVQGAARTFKTEGEAAC